MTRYRLSALLLLLWSWPATAQTVFAAASLGSALEELAPHYEGLQLSFAGSSTLAKQIEAGAPAEIYFSANTEWMDYLQTRQLIEPDTPAGLLCAYLLDHISWNFLHLSYTRPSSEVSRI